MKHYIIVGDNNFWYSTFATKSKKELKEHIDSIKASIKSNLFENNTAEELILYETINDITIKV